MAWRAVSGPSQNQAEVLGDTSGGCYVEHSPRIRHIANHAGDRAAVELNRSGFQDAMPWKNSLLDHEVGTLQEFKESTQEAAN